MPQYNRQTYKYQAGALKGLTLLDDAGKAIARIDDVSKAIDISGDLSRARFFKVGDEIFDISTPRGRQIFMQSMRTLDPTVQAKLAEGMPSLNFRGGTTGLGESPTIEGSQIPMSNRSVPDITSQGSAPLQGISQVPISDVTPVVGSAQPLAFTPNLNPAFVAPSAAFGLTAAPLDALSLGTRPLTSADSAAAEAYQFSPSPQIDSAQTDSIIGSNTINAEGARLAEQSSTTPAGMGRPEAWYDDLFSAFGPFGDIFMQTYAENPGMMSIAALAILNKLHRGLSMSKNFNINDINARRVAKGLPTLTMDDLIASATTKAKQMSYGDQLALLRLVDKDLFRPTKGQGFFKNFYNSAINSLPFMMKRPFAPFFVPGKAAFNKMFDNPAMTKKVAETVLGRQTYRNPYLPFRGGQVKDVKVDNDIISVGTNLYGQENFDRMFKISGGKRDLELSDFLNEEFGFINADKIDDAGNYKLDEVKKFGINAEGFSMNQANSRLMGASRFKDGAKRFLFYVEDVIENPDGDNIGGFFEVFIGDKGKPSKIDFIQQAEFIGAEGPVTYNPKKTGGMFGRGDAFMGVPSDGTLPNTIRSNSRVNIWADRPTIKELGGKKELAESRDYNFNFSTFGIGNVTDEKALDNLLKIGKDLNKQWLDTKNPNTQFYLDEFNPKLSIRSGLPFYRFGGTAEEIRYMMDGYYPEIGSPEEDMFAVPLLV